MAAKAPMTTYRTRWRLSTAMMDAASRAGAGRALVMSSALEQASLVARLRFAGRGVRVHDGFGHPRGRPERRRDPPKARGAYGARIPPPGAGGGACRALADA